jgi:ABC-type glycerol-3-phosphate transport system substrate-binding protein
MRRFTASVVVAFAAAAVTAGCSFSFSVGDSSTTSTPTSSMTKATASKAPETTEETTDAPVVTVSKRDVAKEISTQLEQQVGRAPESVTCPDDLPGEIGTSIRCELDDSGQTFGVTVTVTDVQGKNVKFDIKVDDQPS